MSFRVQNVNTDVRSRDFARKEGAIGFQPHNSYAKEISFGGFGSTLNRVMVDSCHFNNFDARKRTLDSLFGGEFSKMEDELRNLPSKVFDFSKRIICDTDGGVTFVDDGILPKFIKSALYPFKDFWLDMAIWILKGFSKLKSISPLSDVAQRGLNSTLLYNRAKSKEAEDLFCILQGAFSDIAKDEKAFSKLEKGSLGRILERGMRTNVATPADSPELILQNMVHAAGDIKGNYKTADERTINRIFTGLVSSTMAGIDFYNISRMQNDNDELAKKSQQKRFKQESSRILMSAAMTFLTLGALSKYTNSNKYVALVTIAATTLISEVLSRILNGMPLHPLNPDEAKSYAYNKKNKKTSLKGGNNQKDWPHNSVNPRLLNDMPDVFNVFEIGQNHLGLSAKPAFEGVDKPKKEDDSILNFNNLLKCAGVLLVSGLAVCFARSRSEKFNSLLKCIRAGIDDAYNLAIKEDYLVRSDDVLGMLSEISDNFRLNTLADKYRNALNSEKFPRVIKKINGSDVEFINLGRVERKFIAPLIKAITYPFTFSWGVIRFPTKVIRGLFEEEAAKDLSKVGSSDLIGLYKIYKKNKDKLNAGKITYDQFEKLVKRNAIIATENKTGKSTYKNSSLAAISRPLVTLIASYFFVNDYRNEVLIASNGNDVDGANSVAKERTMHKVSNFFFNSLLMNLFNSVFETAYHGSLLGAGAVAAATEFTNENLIRMSIGVPTRKMTKTQIEEHDRRNVERDDFWGKYFRFMSKLTGKKTISQKVQDQEKKKAQKA